MKDLIERLEKATGSDGELNALIDCRVRFPGLRPAKPDDHLEHQNGIPPGRNAIWCPTGFLQATSYTSSLDAAMTLVPNGWNWRVDSHDPQAWVYRSWIDAFSTRGLSAPAASVAIALCIAALKARASLTSHLPSEG